MSNSYTHGSFAVQLSHPDPNAVYLKITDTLNFVCYEGNLQSSDFKKDFAIADQYAILQKCFEDAEHYSVTLSPTSGNLKLKFVALIGGILHWELIVFVKEKILSNDGKLTLDFNRMEQKQEMAIQGLVKRCETLDRRCKLLEDTLEKQSKEFFHVIDRIDVSLYAHCPHRMSCPSQFPIAMPKISCEEITIDNAASFGNMRFENLSVFYKLKKLKISNFIQKPDLTTLANETVTELELQSGGNGTFTSLKGFENFPSLTTLTVISAPGLTNVVAVLKSKPHKIKTLKFQGCGGVNVVELQTYCQENKIFVALS